MPFGGLYIIPTTYYQNQNNPLVYDLIQEVKYVSVEYASSNWSNVWIKVQTRVRRGSGNWEIGCFPWHTQRFSKTDFVSKAMNLAGKVLSQFQVQTLTLDANVLMPTFLKKMLPTHPPPKKKNTTIFYWSWMVGLSNDFVLMILAWWNNPSYIAKYVEL